MSDFGPIASGSIDLRPLNIFVGPNNSGKSYLATLLYALSKSLKGFSRYPSPSTLPAPPFESTEPESPSEEEWIRLAKSLAIRGHTVRLNDFPSIFRTHAESHLQRVVTGNHGLQFKIGHCFDLDALSDLVRWTEAGTDARISVSVTDGTQDFWSFKMGIGSKCALNSNRFTTGELMSQARRSDPHVSAKIQLENPTLMLPRGSYFRNGSLIDTLNFAPSFKSQEVVHKIYSMAIDILKLHSIPRETYFIPASRNGIMQSLDVLACSHLAHLHATRPGLEWFPTPPRSYGMIAVFLMDLLWHRGSPSRNSNPVKQLADELEQRLLGGVIRSQNRDLHGSIERNPRFIYVPNNSGNELRFSRSPSMVTELAPLVLFLRRNVSPHDVLIIEEPEAHLHPEAQTQLAIILAKLARIGVRVIVTTHSGWLLKQVGNLIRQAELETVGESNGGKKHDSGSIQARDVGVWLFRRDSSTGGSTISEIPYDRSDGVEPTEFADVDEELYNRSAALQNLLDDREQVDSL